MKKIRPAAVPLITVDPFFSVWSCADNLYDDVTKHWSGRLAPIMVGIYIDDLFYSMGAVDENLMQMRERIFQTDLRVTPLSSVYEFENEYAKVTLTFTTPLLLDRLDILSRPVSYIKYDIEKKCEETKKIKFVFGINSRCCVNNLKQKVSFKKTQYSLSCGNTVQNPLSQTGDIVMIDWGYLHLLDPEAFVCKCEDVTLPEVLPLDANCEYTPYSEMPYMAVVKKELSGVITLAYDEIYAVEYFGKQLKEYAASSQDGTVRFSSRFYAENFGEKKNTNILPGKAVWQEFAGDWYDATNIYRDFVKRECYWEKGRKSTTAPEWLNEIPLWLMDWVPYEKDSGEILPTRLRREADETKEDDWYKNAIEIQKAIGTPIAYHIYNWHKIPFNNDYPHFLPAKECFTDGLREMKKYDIRIMPYINALLWDTRDRGNEDYMFTSTAKDGAVKKEDGDVQLLTYESREKDGSKVTLAPMCPTSEVWRGFLKNLTQKMFEELDIDAIYLDQASARVPHLCMDKSHTHPGGGGDWWSKAYNELIGELNKTKHRNKAFVSESNSEVYAGSLDGFLSWAWVQTEKDVPAFMRIYSDRIIVLGRNTNGYMKAEDIHWKYHFAQALVCGQQPGWINTDFIKDKKRLEFIKKLVRFRYENKEFFKYPVILRPPYVEAPKERLFVSAVGMYHSGILHRPYICAGALEKENKKMMLFVNIADEDLTDKIKFNEEEYLFNFAKHTTLGEGTIENIKNAEITVTVKKESCFAVIWENDEKKRTEKIEEL